MFIRLRQKRRRRGVHEWMHEGYAKNINDSRTAWKIACWLASACCLCVAREKRVIFTLDCSRGSYSALERERKCKKWKTHKFTRSSPGTAPKCKKAFNCVRISTLQTEKNNYLNVMQCKKIPIVVCSLSLFLAHNNPPKNTSPSSTRRHTNSLALLCAPLNMWENGSRLSRLFNVLKFQVARCHPSYVMRWKLVQNMQMCMQISVDVIQAKQSSYLEQQSWARTAAARRNSNPLLCMDCKQMTMEEGKLKEEVSWAHNKRECFSCLFLYFSRSLSRHHIVVEEKRIKVFSITHFY